MKREQLQIGPVSDFRRTLKPVYDLLSSEVGGFMIVRIRLRKGQPVKRKRGKNRHLALAGGALLIPASLMAYALGAWGLASDMGAAGESGVQGIFSHWQVGIAVGILLNVATSILNRYGRGGELEAPEVLTPRFLPLRRSGSARR
jgi:hypothetical protein